jgi:hypothetical protein
MGYCVGPSHKLATLSCSQCGALVDLYGDHEEWDLGSGLDHARRHADGALRRNTETGLSGAYGSREGLSRLGILSTNQKRDPKRRLGSIWRAVGVRTI